MMVRVLFFAYLRERCGVRETTVDLAEGASVDDLRHVLRARFALPERTPIRFAVNRAYVDSTHVLHENDEVALIPPVSGGAPTRGARR